MPSTSIKEAQRASRHRRIRKKVSGTSECPRLCVHRSLKNFSVQLIDDTQHKVLLGLSTLNKGVKSNIKSGGNIDAATALGKEFAAQAKEKGIVKVRFDRGGYMYHGRVKAFAEAAREGGLEF